ncbi:hypothetical protein BAE42_05970 [Mesorhizobium loti]|uniref:Uncharacterized protein n=1 Tax=Rhizobium loti TaxID=381 RepID=A0A1A5IC95_RHILI|nr:hypothetical protein BAE41_19400 [Mesorhizobium loti]OBP75153.1 hypothetical protein BAE42_05970 [Mesorhizobium loti]OBP76566.1 hypothetical protein BAE39_10640 [Mesorhizobium loti]OBP86734.1 hypothetical protein BAE38_19410 [Mesorhizobium loti]OBP87008.1 hypothetical protein BAE40_27430 [Mesorhizobium loti]
MFDCLRGMFRMRPIPLADPVRPVTEIAPKIGLCLQYASKIVATGNGLAMLAAMLPAKSTQIASEIVYCRVHSPLLKKFLGRREPHGLDLFNGPPAPAVPNPFFHGIAHHALPAEVLALERVATNDFRSAKS